MKMKIGAQVIVFLLKLARILPSFFVRMSPTRDSACHHAGKATSA